MRALFLFVLAACTLSLPAVAADVAFEGPLLGFYADPISSVLRPLVGIPGAATVGPALTTDLEKVWVAPDSRTALGLRQNTIFFVPDVRDTTARQPLRNWTAPIDNVVWSGDSTGALVYSAARRTFQTVTGMPRTPVVNGEVDLTNLPGPLLSLRLGPKPWSVAVVAARALTFPRTARASAASAAPGTELFLISNTGVPVAVSGIAHPGPMDFSGDGATLFVIDKSTGQLMRVSASDANDLSTIPLDPALAAGDFADLAVSREGRILAPEKNARKICSFEISAGAAPPSCSDLDFAPGTMRGVSGYLYLLGTQDDRTAPLWIFDSDAMRTFFVPIGGQR